MTESKHTPHMNELQDIARCLNSLLYDPHPGLITWRQALDAQLVAISPFCPLSTREAELVKALEAARAVFAGKMNYAKGREMIEAALTATGGKG